MKVVSNLYHNEGIKYIVSDDIVKQGIYFGNNNHVLFADKELIEEHKKWLKMRENSDIEDSYELDNFEEYMTNIYQGDCYYKLLNIDLYYSKEELKEIQEQYPYAVDSYNDDKIINTKDFFDSFEIENYIEYWNNGGSTQREVQILYENNKIEKIDSNLDYYETRKTGQYDLYKIDDELALIYVNYYQGELSTVEEIGVTAEELKEKFNYDLREESDQE